MWMSSYLLQLAFSKTKISHISPSFQIQLLLIISLFTTEISLWPQSFYSRKVKLLLALLCHAGTVLFRSVIFRLLFHYHCYLSRSNHFLLILNYCRVVCSLISVFIWFPLHYYSTCTHWILLHHLSLFLCFQTFSHSTLFSPIII